MVRKQRLEVDVEELVAVECEACAGLATLQGRELQPSPASQRLVLAREGELDPHTFERALELALLPGAAADDHALDPGGREAADLVLGERPAGDIDERLRPALRGVAQALRLPAREQDCLH